MCLVSIFVVVARICFNVDIFPLGIVLVFHLTSVLNFCLALLWFGHSYMYEKAMKHMDNEDSVNRTPRYLCVW